MRDYDEKTLLKTDPQTYVTKKVTYGIFHGEKIKKSLLAKYIDKINIKEDLRRYLYFLIEKKYANPNLK